MKKYKYKIIIIIQFVFWANINFAQITISSSETPSANDTIRYSTVQMAQGVDFKTSGANKSWNFTSLNANSQDIYEFKNSTSTPYIFNFGLGAIGLKMADSLGSGQMGLKDIYNFFKKSTGKWEAIGIGFKLSVLPLPQAGKYTNNDEIYQFPLNFNDKDSSSFYLNIPLTAYTFSIGNFYRWGNRVNYVDGWGKISTPYKSDVECLRIKSVITEIDSFAISLSGQAPINFAFPNDRIEYKWLVKNEKIPMLEVVGSEIGGNFVAREIKYRDKYRVIYNPLAPVADFEADDITPETGQIVNFTDKSTNNPISYDWVISPSNYTFETGTSNTSKNPKVKFNAASKYTVKLTATNIAGKNTTTKTEYITVNNNATIKQIPNLLIKAYPNPANNIINFEAPEFKNNYFKVFVFDIKANNVISLDYSCSNNNISIETVNLPNGQYTAVIANHKSVYFSVFNVVK
ncbi:MAG: PKD domain-containing protein [Bacteroidia bacterium]|nr:PKD domain-containing protein [Bacteroidia bacterium]